MNRPRANESVLMARYEAEERAENGPADRNAGLDNTQI